MTVANFEKLANSGFYDGVRFHRVIDDFVVQGGDPLSRDLPPGDRKVGTGGPGWTIKCETNGNPHKHAVGALSMAHAGKDTGGSQFFMVLSEANAKHLNGVHTVFGQLVTGAAEEKPWVGPVSARADDQQVSGHGRIGRSQQD